MLGGVGVMSVEAKRIEGRDLSLIIQVFPSFM